MATTRLRSPLALAWRLQRGSLLIWSAVFLLVGLVVGGLASNVGDFVQSQQARDFINRLGGEGVLRDAFLAVELSFAAVGASVFGVLATTRLRSEETGLRAEPVLATAVRRTTWLWSHLTIALLGSAVLMVTVGVGAGLTNAAQVGEPVEFWRVLVAAMVRIPAVWVVVGIVVAAFGLLPRWTVLGWLALLGFVLLGEFGPLFELDQFVMDLSPFAHVPRLPGGDFSLTPLLWLAAVAAALVALGTWGFRRRDVG
jgi:ABC-2 type transport system permease protein